MIQKQKMIYLLNHLDHYIEQLAYNVLDDSLEKPEYSAVTLFNLIRCYIDVSKELDMGHQYLNEVDYLLAKCFEQREVDKLRERSAQEAKYYIGKQYQ
jgi:hypothetical protein